MNKILILFIALTLIKLVIETLLEILNKSSYEDHQKQNHAIKTLGLKDSEFKKSLLYARDKFKLSFIQNWLSEIILLSFLAFGGYGIIDNYALDIVGKQNPISQGLIFFLFLFILALFLSLPFAYYSTFFIEEKHGFNKQTRTNFFLDQSKEIIISICLSAIILSAILSIMQTGDKWWILAWVAYTIFIFLTMWLYPVLLAPLFNKFTPLEEGELKDSINKLSKKIGFETDGIFIMDASKRSSHGNAYFTGILKKKRIVLFDTLTKSLNHKEIVAVLAHELGHFKLHHIRQKLLTHIILTGLSFYILSLFIKTQSFYTAFGFTDINNHVALIIFSLWLGLINFIFTPLKTWLSRKDEFAADKFAHSITQSSSTLIEALKKISDQNKSIPICHPIYSAFYYSHPPLLERIASLKKLDS